MKNMKIVMKLAVSFLIMIVLSTIVGLVGIYGMNAINSADDDLYNYNVIALEALGSMRENFVTQQRDLRTCIIRDSGSSTYREANQRIKSLQGEMLAHMSMYASTINTKEDEDLFARFSKSYNEYQVALEKMLEMTEKNWDAEALDILDNEGATIASETSATLAEAEAFNADAAHEAINNNTSLFQSMAIIEVVVLAATIAIAVFLILYISGLVSKPIKILTGFMSLAGSTGNITLRAEDMANIEKFAKVKDEMGQCIASTASFIKHINNIADDLGMVANGDLTTDVHVLTEDDVLGVAVRKMVDNLNKMFGDINTATIQVSAGSKQIADGSQNLAQGSTEQASAVEELSSSISDIAQQTKLNAETAEKAAKLADIIKGNAEKGSRQMNEMVSAVREINQASQSISKVIKVIDDIAFQTNILALNAAVEAARAGQHGKGFAVVAEEVRNLAGKSAEAAKDTGGLISNTIEKAELGARIADETAVSLAEIVTGINESSRLVGDIARSSDEQSEGISQINRGIDQVTQVIQQNSATAEESAAASQEMSGQADMLETLVAQFKLKEGGADRFKGINSAKIDKRRMLPMPSASHVSPVDEMGGMGKY